MRAAFVLAAVGGSLLTFILLIHLLSQIHELCQPQRMRPLSMDSAAEADCMLALLQSEQRKLVAAAATALVKTDAATAALGAAAERLAAAAAAGRTPQLMRHTLLQCSCGCR
jgi:hypothetical protein